MAVAIGPPKELAFADSVPFVEAELVRALFDAQVLTDVSFYGFSSRQPAMNPCIQIKS